MSKKIEINPTLFKIKNNTIKNKRKSVKKNQNQNISSLRKKILEQLNKKTQEKKTNNNDKKNTKNIATGLNDSFTNSLNFLEKELKDNSNDNSNLSNTDKQDNSSQVLEKKTKSAISTDTASNGVKKPIVNNTEKKSKIEIVENVNLELPESLQEIQLDTNKNLQESNIKITTTPSNKCNTRKNRDEPQYGCLKNGLKPTLSKDKTAKNRIMFSDKLEHFFDEKENIKKNDILEPKPKIDVDEKPKISDEIIPLSIDEFPEELNSVLPEIKRKKPKQNRPIHNQTLTNIKKNKKNRVNKTIKILGKDEKKKKVSLIINNNNIRKTIKKEKHILNTTPIKKIKKHLKEKGLIQVDSNAPEDVLRTIYTNSKLSGDVENKNGDMLINNYLNDKELNEN